MLRLKRHSTDKVSIAWRERTSPSKRLVGKAFAYSLLIHAVMIMGFQIRTNYIDQHGTPSAPTVFLDADDSSVAILTDMRSGEDDPRLRLIRELHLTHSSLACTMNAVHASYSQSLASLHPSPDVKREFLPIINLPWSLCDDLAPSHYLCRAYPLKITLHQDLRSLQLTDDGARLFRKATSDTMLSTPAFSEIQPMVEFKIDVSLATGKVVHSTCVRELLDKRLQGVAQHIIKCLRFNPSNEQRTISGILALQFAGTFDTISTLLDAEP